MHGCGREEREDEEARILDQSFGASVARAAAAVPGEAWAKFTLFLAPLQTRSRQMRMWDLAPAHSPTLKGEAIHA
jgi:hypothetical protein